MSNSKLASYTKISPNKNSPRNHAIDTITIHCTAGNKDNTARQIADFFSTTARGASCNYAVGGDGSIAMSVEEKDRSWCTSSGANDHRAITIEVCSNIPGTEVNDKAYDALIDLVTDICQRNGIKKLVWSTSKNDRVNHLNGCNMTVHRDYANKSCPGEWLYSRHGQIADAVNKRLGVATDTNVGSTVAQPVASDECPFAVGDSVEFLQTATKYNPAGAGIPAWVKNGYTHIVTAIASNGKAVMKGGERCVLLGKKVNKTTSKAEAGINTWASVNALQKVGVAAAAPFKAYKVKVTADELNIRKGPGTGYATNGAIKDKGVYTIVLEDATGKWGKLKSGAGWISLAYTKTV